MCQMLKWETFKSPKNRLEEFLFIAYKSVSFLPLLLVLGTENCWLPDIYLFINPWINVKKTNLSKPEARSVPKTRERMGVRGCMRKCQTLGPSNLSEASRDNGCFSRLPWRCLFIYFKMIRFVMLKTTFLLEKKKRKPCYLPIEISVTQIFTNNLNTF